LCAAWLTAIHAGDKYRHTTATYLKTKGVDTDIIGAILGHKSSNITLRYAQITEAQRAQIVEKHG
jgi:site-specific recombinase XerD